MGEVAMSVDICVASGEEMGDGIAVDVMGCGKV